MAMLCWFSSAFFYYNIFKINCCILILFYYYHKFSPYKSDNRSKLGQNIERGVNDLSLTLFIGLFEYYNIAMHTVNNLIYTVCYFALL